VSTDPIAAGSQAANQPIAQATSDENSGAPKKRKLDKTRKAFRFVLAVDAWKRQAGHLKHRASFPLLRQVLRTELKQARTTIALSTIPDDVLQRSLLSHLFILLFAVPASLWAAYMTTKGLAAGIRFDFWFNGWLLQGLPVFIFCVMKALTSNHSRIIIQRELATRSTQAVRE
jgi:hypothetical protein